MDSKIENESSESREYRVNDYGLLPIAMRHWLKYLPSTALPAVTLLYLETTLGGKFRAFTGLDEIISKLEEYFDPIPENSLSEFDDIDRELLQKEICDFNGLPYPVDAQTTFDYLCGIGFIVIKQVGTKAEFWMRDIPPHPAEVLKLPEGYDDRVEQYQITGSVLFSYLTIDEIVGNAK